MFETDHSLVAKNSGTSHFSTIFSLSLVLFMIGLLGVILFEAKKLSDYFKENIEITLILKDDAAIDSINILENYVNAKPYVNKFKFISKELAAESLKKDLGEDFLGTLGYNPLFASYSLHLKPQYANADSIRSIQTDLSQFPILSEVYFHETLVNSINNNIKKIGLILGGICMVFLFIAFTMIDNTMRLNMFSNRFIIKSMQLVGATNKFIRKPYITQSVINGLIAGIIAVTILNIIMFFVGANIPDFRFSDDIFIFAFWYLLVILLGVLISFWSTGRALNKYLTKKLEELY